MNARTEEPRTAYYECRYGVEAGEVFLPAISPPDWTGKRRYITTDRAGTVYLFDDELLP